VLGVAAVQPPMHQELPESVAAHRRIGAINVSYPCGRPRVNAA
jgi:hypothetical protein